MSVLRTTIVLALILYPATVRADFTYAGTLDSWEWLVDSSSIIVTGRVERLIDKNTGCVCRIASVLKHPKDAAPKPGGELKVSIRPWRPPPTGADVLVFVPPDAAREATIIELPKDGDAKQGYLLPDKFGRVVRKTDVLLKKLSERIQQANVAAADGFAMPRRASFVHWPSTSEVDTGSEYFYIRVPPDEDLRKLVEGYGPEFQAILYRFYAGRTAKQFKADRQRDRDNLLKEAKAQFAKGNRTFSYRSFVTYPTYDFVILSPDGKHVAVLERKGGAAFSIETDEPLPAPTTTVYETANNAPIARIEKCHEYQSGAQAIFSPDGKLFAYLDQEKVSIFNLATGKQVTGALGWKVTLDSTYASQFTFSPDGNFLALNLHSGQAGTGSAVVVWRTDTGEAVYVKSKNWDLKRELRFVGFGPRSDCIHVTESTFYLLTERREASYIATGWSRPNPDGEKNSTNGKLRAHLDKEKVSIVNVETGKLHATGALGWKITNDSAHPSQFTFSADGKFLALTLSSGQPGMGTAIVVWHTDTGEAVYVKSKSWELKREFRFVGFGPYSTCIQVTESTFWKLNERQEASLIATDWHRPNRDGETEPSADRLWVNPVEVPGVRWNVSPRRKSQGADRA